MARATEVMPMLGVADLAASLRFYRDGLGGTESYRLPAEGEIEFIVLRFGDSEIGFSPELNDPIHGEARRPASGHRIELCIYVDDVDAAVAELGAPVLKGPADQPWGERCAFVTDPDGNIVMLDMKLG